MSKFASDAELVGLMSLFVMLSLGGCEGSFIRPENLGKQVQIKRTYEARDVCLAKNAASEASSTVDATLLARAVAQSCTAETENLVTSSNFDGNARVASNIPQDSQYRALKFVLQERHQAIF